MAETAAAGGSAPLRPAGVPSRRGAPRHARVLSRERDPRASSHLSAYHDPERAAPRDTLVTTWCWT
jgi:hypothetical protein